MKKLLLTSLIAFALCFSAFSQTNETTVTEAPTTSASPYQGVRVFPNPSVAGIFNLKIEDNQNDFIQFTVNDLKGKLIMQSDLKETGRTECIINLENVPSGVYVLTLFGKQNKLIFRLSKMATY
jgi:hypothetical protein